MKRYHFERVGSIGIVTAAGDLTAKGTDELKALLLRCIGTVDHVIFNLDRVTSLDFASLRLLQAAHRICRAFRKRMTLVGFRDKPFRKALEKTILSPGYAEAQG